MKREPYSTDLVIQLINLLSDNFNKGKKFDKQIVTNFFLTIIKQAKEEEREEIIELIKER